MVQPTARNLLLICAAVALTGAFTPYASAQSSSGIYIDRLVFSSSVPHQMVLGQSYTVKVLIVNNSTEMFTGSVALGFPQDLVSARISVKNFQVLAGDSQSLTFIIVPIDLHSGGLNVSAILLVAQGLQLRQLQRVTATVDGITGSSLFGNLGLYLVVGVLAAGSLYAFVVMLRRQGISDPDRRKPALGPTIALFFHRTTTGRLEWLDGPPYLRRSTSRGRAV